MKQETIRIKNVNIGYRTKEGIKTVAHDIDASINSSELTCLLGANGVGKSTLLRTLSAFLPTLSGTIEVLGKEISSYKDKELAQVISMVLTERPEVHNLSAFEMVGLGRTPYTDFWGRLREEDEKVIERSMALVGIEHLTHRMVHTLSDGERQKVMIAKALAQETPIILLDEPTAFLDFPSKVEMMQLLLRLSRETDKTIFLSTHDLELALQLSDRLWLMERNRDLSIGTPEELSKNGSIARFISRKGVVFDAETLTVKVLRGIDE